MYCVEDVDNKWVTDHFRSTYLDPRCLTNNTVTEREIVDSHIPNESYVGITIHRAAYVVEFDQLETNAFVDKEELNKTIEAAKLLDELNFIPYYYRANRGGRGMARVGLRQWAW